MTDLFTSLATVAAVAAVAATPLTAQPASAAMPVVAEAAPPARGGAPDPGVGCHLTPPAGQGEAGDWGFVGCFKTENAQFKSQPPGGARVVFMGDSVTQFWRQRSPFFASEGYAGRGIVAQTAAQMLVRFRSDVLDLHPAVVHIMAGTNDVAQNAGPETDEEILGYLASMVELAQANGVAVILAAIPPSADFPWSRGLHPAQRIQALNLRLKAYAAARHAVFVDYGQILAAPDGAMKAEYTQDGAHPTAMGYAAIEPMTRAAIARALSAKPGILSPTDFDAVSRPSLLVRRSANVASPRGSGATSWAAGQQKLTVELWADNARDTGSDLRSWGKARFASAPMAPNIVGEQQ
jgi:lysophospholipase L1-like esterase